MLITKPDQQDVLIKQKRRLLLNAMVYAERAYHLDPEMKEIQRALIDIYSELNLAEKLKEIEESIQRKN